MKIVIDINENLFTRLFDCGTYDAVDMLNVCTAVRKGTPLPKGHGDLKDIQDIINKINLNYNNHQSIDAYSLKDMIATVPTIIEADKAESEDRE